MITLTVFLLVWAVANLAALTYASFRDIDAGRADSFWMTFGAAFLGIFFLWVDRNHPDRRKL